MPSTPLTFPLAGTLSRPLNTTRRWPTGAAAFDPATLFASGEKGWWYDPSDFDTMFQDAAGTTAVTAVGQPVGKLLDKSGNNYHLAQSTDAKRPILRQDGDGFYYLEGNGNYKLDTPGGGFAMGSAAEYSTFIAVYNTVAGVMFDMAINLGGPGAQQLSAFATEAKYSIRSAISSVCTLNTAVNLSAKYVLSASFNLPAAGVTTDAFLPRVNGAASTVTATVPDMIAQAGMGDVYLSLMGIYGAGSEVTGRCYGFIMRAATCTTEETEGAESYLALQSGATL